MALNYERIDVKLLAGSIASLPIDSTKAVLQGNDFIQDTYIASLKPGVVVTMDEKGFIKPAGAEADKCVLGFLVNDAAGYYNQNMNANSSHLAAVLVGGGNQFVTDNIKETDIKPGAFLYVGADGILTKTKGTLTTAVAVALTANSATSKAVLVQTLI